MNRYTNTTITIATLLIFGCADTAPQQNEKMSNSEIEKTIKDYNKYCDSGKIDYINTKEYRNGRYICLSGPIDHEFYLRYIALAPTRSDIVVIRSGGGEAGIAMDVGDALWRTGNLVIVDDICGSSCAYFIALGGHKLALTRDGGLGFHGGPISDAAVLADNSLDAAAKLVTMAESARFREFFYKRGIDISITTDVPERFKYNKIDWHKSMWMISAYGLKKYGFHNVVYCDSKYCKFDDDL